MTPAFHDAATELAQARALLPVNTRAAGAVCGVALERALQAAAESGLESIVKAGILLTQKAGRN